MRVRRLRILVLALTIGALSQLAQAQTGGTVLHLPLVASPDPVAVEIRTEAGQPVRVLTARSELRTTGRAVVGEVINSSTAPVYQVRISGTFYNSIGQEVASDDTFAFLPLTAPGQRNPFEVYVAQAPAGIARVALTVTWRNTPQEEYRPITVVSQELRQDGPPRIVGTVRHDGPGALREPEVAVTFYDDDDNVVGVGVAVPAVAPLPAGAPATYSVAAGNRGLVFSRYTVQAQGTLGP